MSRKDVPFGIQLCTRIRKCFQPVISDGTRTKIFQGLILVLTYFTYAFYHLSRKPISIVKNVLNRNCSELTPPEWVIITDDNKDNWCDWAPFDTIYAQTLLGTLDSCFLFAYAIGVFVSGFIAERANLRYFLAFGMLASGILTYLFGLGYSLNIHSAAYYFIILTLAGFAQSTGWPGVVTAVGNWFGEGKRGLLFGIWNSHTSVGNILGSLIAGYYVDINWGMSFIIPGLLIAIMGFINFLFLAPDPQSVGCAPADHQEQRIHKGKGYSAVRDGSRPDLGRTHRYANSSSASSTSSLESELDSLLTPTDNSVDSIEGGAADIFPSEMTNSSAEIMDAPPLGLNNPDIQHKEKAIGFFQALYIPGVIEFSLCLFFSKLVSYTFLFWLPRYINSSTSFDPSQSATLSTLFDVGGVMGGVIAGLLSDVTGMSAVVCSVMLVFAVPLLFVYQSYGAISLTSNICLLMAVGLMVNGPYALITTAVSTELGTHKSLKGSARALATVTAIIDGTGSIGAAVGPLMAGAISDSGWQYVFYMLMASDIIALLLLSRLVKNEIHRFREKRREVRHKRERIA